LQLRQFLFLETRLLPISKAASEAVSTTGGMISTREALRVLSAVRREVHLVAHLEEEVLVAVVDSPASVVLAAAADLGASGSAVVALVDASTSTSPTAPSITPLAPPH